MRRDRPYGRSISIVLLLVILAVLSMKTLRWFGVGNSVLESPAVMHVAAQSVVNVSIDKSAMKRAEDGLKLYAGDEVVTTPRNTASLSFFDGSFARLNESSQLTIEKSAKGKQQSTLTVHLDDGALWLSTPMLTAFSGSIVRTVVTPVLTVTVPSRTEAVITGRSIVVYAADGAGLTVNVAGNAKSIIIGEGQQFTVPEGKERIDDLYTLRSPLSPDMLASPFITESRQLFTTNAGSSVKTTSGKPQTAEASLTMKSPQDNATITTSTVEVQGSIGPSVQNVRINGYLANLDAEKRTFRQELALPDEDDVKITTEAVDANGTVVGQDIRTIHRNRTPPVPPTIETPAHGGQTYRTSATEIEIRGTAPKDAVAIVVNDYKLQLFAPGQEDWSYLAKTSYDNFTQGENVYTVYAINQGGYKSAPVTITIILGEGGEGIVGGASSTVSAGAAASTAEESALPQNPPKMPGSVRVTAPVQGTQYATDQKEFLIEGIVPHETASVWINGYKLQLYAAGKTFFNYIASTDLFTMKPGRNVYRIVARDKNDQILDTISFVVQFTPN